MLKLYTHCLYKLRKIFYENYFGKLYKYNSNIYVKLKLYNIILSN